MLCCLLEEEVSIQFESHSHNMHGRQRIHVALFPPSRKLLWHATHVSISHDCYINADGSVFTSKPRTPVHRSPPPRRSNTSPFFTTQPSHEKSVRKRSPWSFSNVRRITQHLALSNPTRHPSLCSFPRRPRNDRRLVDGHGSLRSR